MSVNFTPHILKISHITPSQRIKECVYQRLQYLTLTNNVFSILEINELTMLPVLECTMWVHYLKRV